MSNFFLKTFIAIAFICYGTVADDTVTMTNLALSFSEKLFKEGLNFLGPIVTNNLKMPMDLTDAITDDKLKSFVIEKLDIKDNSFDITIQPSVNPTSPAKATVVLKEVDSIIDIKYSIFPVKITKINNLTVDVTLSKTKDGHPELGLDVKKLDFKTDSWFTDIAASMLTVFKSLINSSATKAINDLLKDVTMTPALGNTPIALDFSMNHDPYTQTFNNINTMTLNFGGVFLNNNTLEESKNKAAYDNIVPLDSSTMISLNFGAAVSNSLVSVLRDLGYLRYTVSADQLDESTKGYLNTKFFRFLLKPLFAKYPDNDLRFTVDTPEDPKFSLPKDKEGMYFNTKIALSFDIKKNGEYQFAEDSKEHSISLVFNPKALISAKLKKDDKSGLYVLNLKVEYETTEVETVVKDESLDATAFGDVGKNLEDTINGIFLFGASTLNLLVREGIKIDPKRWKLGFGVSNAVLKWTDKNCGIGIDLSLPAKGTDDYKIIDDFFKKQLGSIDLSSSSSTSRRSVDFFDAIGTKLTQKLLEPFSESVKKAAKKTSLFAIRQLDRLAERAKKEDLLGGCKKESSK